MTSLNPRYTFDSFVIGSTNRFAHAAARRVAESPGTSYNPLLVHGPAGLGKTHLLHAIGHAVTGIPGRSARLVSTQTLVEDLVRFLRRGAGGEFRRDYAASGVLLLDDIQVLAGKDGLQEELAQLVARRVDEHQQVVLVTGDSPGATPVLEDAIYKRSEMGLTVDVQPPDLELRIALVEHLAAKATVCFPEEVLELVAVQVTTDVRRLDAALTRVTAFAQLADQPITAELTRRALNVP